MERTTPRNRTFSNIPDKSASLRRGDEFGSIFVGDQWTKEPKGNEHKKSELYSSVHGISTISIPSFSNKKEEGNSPNWTEILNKEMEVEARDRRKILQEQEPTPLVNSEDKEPTNPPTTKQENQSQQQPFFSSNRNPTLEKDNLQQKAIIPVRLSNNSIPQPGIISSSLPIYGTELEHWQEVLEAQTFFHKQKSQRENNLLLEFEKWKSELHFVMEESMSMFEGDFDKWESECQSDRNPISMVPKRRDKKKKLKLSITSEDESEFSEEDYFSFEDEYEISFQNESSSMRSSTRRRSILT